MTLSLLVLFTLISPAVATPPPVDCYFLIAKVLDEPVTVNLTDREMDQIVEQILNRPFTYRSPPEGRQIFETLEGLGMGLKELLKGGPKDIGVLTSATQKELAILAREPKMSRKLALRVFEEYEESLTPEFIQRNAGIFLLAKIISSIPSEKSYLLEREFAILTRLEGLKARTVKKSYRYDGRSPHEIREAKGFFPSPGPFKRVSTIYEHSNPNRLGSSFVSMSIQAGNRFNLGIGPVISGSRKIAAGEVDTKLLEEARSSWKFKGDIQVHQIREYELENAFVVEPHESSRIPKEKELIAPFVPVERVSRFREVTYFLDLEATHRGSKTETIAYVSFGPWQKFANP